MTQEGDNRQLAIALSMLAPVLFDLMGLVIWRECRIAARGHRADQTMTSKLCCRPTPNTRL
jgi:hypothetical protein